MADRLAGICCQDGLPDLLSDNETVIALAAGRVRAMRPAVPRCTACGAADMRRLPGAISALSGPLHDGLPTSFGPTGDCGQNAVRRSVVVAELASFDAKTVRVLTESVDSIREQPTA